MDASHRDHGLIDEVVVDCLVVFRCHVHHKYYLENYVMVKIGLQFT